MNKKILAIMGVALMGASAYLLNKVEVQSNVAGADDATTVSITCANGGTVGYVANSMAATTTIGHDRGGPQTSCSVGSVSLDSGTEIEVPGDLTWHCVHSGVNIQGYVSAPKMAADLTCSGNSKVTSAVYGAESGQGVQLGVWAFTTDGPGSNRFDNVTSGSAVVLYGTSGIVSTDPVADGGTADHQKSRATDQFVVTNGWYLGFQIPADSKSTKTSTMNTIQTPGT